MTTLFIMTSGAFIVLTPILIISRIFGTYNRFIRLRNNIQTSFANIDVLLNQRADEIPNLVSIVKGYATHEQELFATIAAQRASLLTASSVTSKADADNTLAMTTKSLFAVAESYPTLKADTNFLNLQHRLSEIEEHIADRREYYNATVTVYNNRVQSFPASLIARICHFGQQEWFRATDSQRQSINVFA